MNRLDLNHEHLAHHEDWVGNNVTFTCPLCDKVFIVSGSLHRGTRACPNCGESTGHVQGKSDSGGRAWLEWQPSLGS